MSDSSGKAIVYAAAGFLFGIWTLYGGLKRHLLVQKINNTPTSKVEGAAVGLIELSGKAECHDPAVSPISKVNSAYWKVVAEYYYNAGKHSGWRPVWSGESSRQFYLQDETGKMLIDSRGGDVDIPYDHLFQGYIAGKGEFGLSHTPMPPEVLEFINGLDAGPKAAFMARQHENVRIFEYYIADDDPLYVLGNAEPQDNAPSSLGYENLIVKKGAADRTLYISDTGERNVVKKLSGGVYWEVFGGLALSAVCLIIVLLIIGVR